MLTKLVLLALFANPFTNNAIAAEFTPPATFIPASAGQWLTGNFVQNRYLAGFDQPVRSSGQYWFDPDLGLVWQVEAPFPSILVMMSDRIVEIDGETTRLLVGNQAGIAQIAAIAGQSLSGDWSSLAKTFDLLPRNSDAGWQFRLLPKQESMIRFLDHLDIAGDQQVETLTIAKTGGDRDELLFSNQQPGDTGKTPLPDRIRHWFDRAGAAK